MLSAQVRALISESGASAARGGADVTDCPFDPSAGAHPRERERARVWVGGYLGSRPPAPDQIDYTIDDASERAWAPAVPRAARSQDVDDLDVTRLDTHPGDGGIDGLKAYWMHGEGAAKWVDSPTPWTSLEHELAKHVDPEKAKRIAAAWFHERFGYWPGSDKNRVAHGHPPRGERVGPG